MFKSPLNRLSQTSTHLIKTTTKTSRTMSSAARPTGLIANSGIELLTFGTPNGHKASILLEELKAAYGKEYTFQSINIMENIQKEPWFTKICPNGRIPAIVDHDRKDFAVFEGAAILAYLTRHYDPDHRFSFADEDDYSRAEQWIAWQHGGLGPMQGQANHFYRIIKDRIPYPTQRYVGETERLYGVLDIQLQDRDYMVGPGRGKYSIADIASFGWVNVSYFAGLDLAQFPNLHRWWNAVSQRPAVKKGTEIPSKSQLVNEAIPERLETDPEFRARDEELKKAGAEAKKLFDYKFSAP
ncbi:Disulfide-bond oxidoreductase YfcG [Lachnellula arida]|uniref:Disulfide-bond oxidoreductase YfcG n=1 Tax=Lachnellula arida TaxID=1316785 RepID=A0A8T9BP30_9HELO|nr:Disulfide-bond oxidoreductase YfcG [Lachnellula arida]